MLWSLDKVVYGGFRNSKVSIPIWLEYKSVQDFMPVQIISKSRKDPIKAK